ncbi:protein of unknown function [Candidatus Filomicrobium marinum]|uniref:Uncharacterized protein n=1 Tax=Candidatus Filomicrobium marinum TaxID=1608628 RepID=A0A0D6JBF4_9HYPH|nr:protein of unknown function [Candidatus Filomicrobium marinum]CPR16331.1 protein of unknown function [Candidatus Filomicrobium marinum]
MLLRFRKRILFGSDVRPFVSVFPIDLEPFLQVRLRVGLNRVDGAFRFAHTTINALVRVNDEHIFPFIEAVYRANLHAIRELAFDAALINNVSHASDRAPYGRLSCCARLNIRIHLTECFAGSNPAPRCPALNPLDPYGQGGGFQRMNAALLKALIPPRSRFSTFKSV